MRFLRTASRWQIRLGWLNVITGIVGTDRIDLSKIQNVLSLHSDQFSHWLADSAFATGGISGKFSSSSVNRLARMGITYGIYDEASERLTDLGNILRIVSPWTPLSQESPFIWTGAKRWVGLWIAFQAAGDVLLAILKNWPDDDELVKGPAGVSAVGHALEVLARSASSEEKQVLEAQAERAKGDDTYENYLSMAPYLEPLRDLGYLLVQTPHGRSRGLGFSLTPEGRRLRAAFAYSPGTADAIIQSGLSRAFLSAEGVEAPLPANGMVLAQVLSELPDELKGAAEEAPLDAAVVLAQAKLVRERSGSYLDLQSAHALIQEVESRCEGKVYLKRGQSIHQLNVAWKDSKILADALLWDVALQQIGSASASANQHLQEVSGPSALTPSALTPNDNAVSSAGITTAEPLEKTAELHSPAHREAAEGAAKTEGKTTGQQTLKLDGNGRQGPESRTSIDPYRLLRETVPPAVRLWLQYVHATLSPPESVAADLIAWGGPVVALHRLKALRDELPDNKLTEKRQSHRDPVYDPLAQKAPVCTISLRQMAELLASQWFLTRVCQFWPEQQHAQIDPIVLIERALERTLDIQGELRARIERFLNWDVALDETRWQEWPLVRDATRCLVHDAVATGLGSIEELRQHILSRLVELEPQAAAIRFLDFLSATEHDYEYTLSLALDERMALWTKLDVLAKDSRDGNPPDGIEVIHCKQGDDLADALGKSKYRFHCAVQARSRYEALVRGRAKVHSLLVNRLYASLSPEHASVDLPPDVLDDEDAWELGQDTSPPAGENPAICVHGLSFLHLTPSASERAGGWLLPARNEVLEHGRPGDRERLERAMRHLVQARDPGRSPSERLVLAWSAIEQLVAGRKASKEAAISPLAAASSLLLFRAETHRTHKEAMAGLLASAILHPTHPEAMDQIRLWLPQMKSAVLALAESPRRILEVRLASGQGFQLPDFTEVYAFGALWSGRDRIPTLRTFIEPLAPLAASHLHRYYRITGDGKPAPSGPGNGRLLAEHFLSLYENTLSFVYHVYEVRNRIIHNGTYQESGLIDLYRRFWALVLRVMQILASRLGQAGTLERIWQVAVVLSQELVSLGRKDGPPLTRERLWDLVDL